LSSKISFWYVRAHSEILEFFDILLIYFSASLIANDLALAIRYFLLAK
jgi:hypothetical protein